MDAGRLREHLAANAGTWFPALRSQPAEIRLTRSREKTFSTLLQFELQSGDARAYVIAKVRRAPDERAKRLPGWEFLVPLAKRSERLALEFAALERIHERFSGLGDPRFGTARPLDLLPESSTLLLEDVRQPNLSQWLEGGARERGAHSTALFNAGAWLRQFHEMPTCPAAQEHPTTRDSFIKSVRERTEALGRSEDDASFFRDIDRRAAHLADAHFPDAFPTATTHADYWPGNILVAPDGRVTVIDTFGAWSGAVFHDLAYFLNDLKASNHRVYRAGLSRNAGRTADLEAQFLAGYFGEEPIPWRPLRLFEVQLLLHNWRRATYSAREASLAAKPTRKLRLMLKRPYYRRLVSRLLREAEANAWTQPRP